MIGGGNSYELQSGLRSIPHQQQQCRSLGISRYPKDKFPEPEGPAAEIDEDASAAAGGKGGMLFADADFELDDDDDDDSPSGWSGTGGGLFDGDDDDSDDYSSETPDFDAIDASGVTDDELEWSKNKRIRDEYGRIQEEIKGRTGRGWTDSWTITDDDWMAGRTFDDIEEWVPTNATRKSLEAVKVHPDGVPTLRQLASLTLPPSPPPHPGRGTPSIYAAHRKRQNRQRILTAISTLASSDMRRIATSTTLTWDEKQDAVDELYETMPEKVRKVEPVLGKQPDFEEKKKEDDKKKEVAKKEEVEAVVPLFIDLLAAKNSNPSDDEEDNFFYGETDDHGVPNLVYPLKSHGPDDTTHVGRMTEEWDLAAHKKTKRILIRGATKEVAEALADAIEVGSEGKGRPARVAIHGAAGAGKTALLSSIVASSRMSGCVVTYLPDGDRLRKLGYYVEPSSRHKGLYDLPEIARELCAEMSECHGRDLKRFGLSVDVEGMGEFFTKDQVEKVLAKVAAMAEDDEGDDDGKEDQEVSAVTTVPLDVLLEIGGDNPNLSSGCHSAAVSTLMSQTQVPYVVAMDEFNCYYDRIGHYYHVEYDEDVYKSIPLGLITAFKPFLDAMGLGAVGGGANNVEGMEEEVRPALMKRGAIVVATSETRAVARKVTDAVVESAHGTASTSASSEEEEISPIRVVEVQRFSALEVEHVLYNYDVIGIGRLRFEGGDTVLNPEEIAYLRMVSGARGQLLLDACII